MVEGFINFCNDMIIATEAQKSSISIKGRDLDYIIYAIQEHGVILKEKDLEEHIWAKHGSEPGHEMTSDRIKWSWFTKYSKKKELKRTLLKIIKEYCEELGTAIYDGYDKYTIDCEMGKTIGILRDWTNDPKGEDCKCNTIRIHVGIIYSGGYAKVYLKTAYPIPCKGYEEIDY